MRTAIVILATLLVFPLPVHAQSMPQLFGEPPVEYVGSDLVEVTFRTTPEAVESLVPEPLVPSSSDTISVFFGLQKVPALKSYHEMIVFIPSSYNGKSGVYHPVLYLDEAAPIVAGREWWGFPKVDGDFVYEREKNEVSATLTRDGQVLLEFSASLSSPGSDVQEREKTHGFVVREIPAADGSSTPALLQLNSYTIRDWKIYETQVGEDISFNLTASEEHFMPALPVIEVVRAVAFKTDFILDWGQVEYDYLANAATER